MTLHQPVEAHAIDPRLPRGLRHVAASPGEERLEVATLVARDEIFLAVSKAAIEIDGRAPDADDDGIDDLSDACPTTAGVATSDPETNGCPDQDRDHDGVLNDADACPDERGTPDIDPRRNGCPKAILRASRIELLDPVDWRPGTTELVSSPENEARLTALLSVVLELPEGRKLRIEGHTDSRGDAAGQKRLSAGRAAAVAKWLAEHGIDKARVSSEGFGPDRPTATNETEAGRAENRRLEFHLDP